ncbi:MAG TPA: hypothetical protein VGD40_04125 [Chryseosolibacter sp.]
MNPLKLLAIALVISLQIGPVLAQVPDDNEGFNLVKEKDNISIYERWRFFPKTDPPVEAREVKGVFYAKTDFKEAVALLKNEKLIYEWQSHVSKFKVYPQTDTTWFEYSYHDIPWPVADQDHFLIYEIQHESKELVYVTFESITNDKLAPVDEDAHRMRLAGSWLFEKEKDRIKITYRIYSFPSSIPRIFTDPVIRSNMMSTIKEYIKLVEN